MERCILGGVLGQFLRQWEVTLSTPDSAVASHKPTGAANTLRLTRQREDTDETD